LISNIILYYTIRTCFGKTFDVAFVATVVSKAFLVLNIVDLVESKNFGGFQIVGTNFGICLFSK
jgi:hypothetical protein